MPPYRRADLLARQLAEPPFGERRFSSDDPPVRAGATGTGDDLLVLAWSATQLAADVSAGTRVLGGLGIAAGMRVANTLPGALFTPGALLLGDVNEAIGALDVPLGVVENANAARAAWELVDRVECAVVMLAPETAAAFLDGAGTTSRPWWQGVVWLDRGGRSPRPALPAGFGGWQRSWLAIPEVASFVGGSREDDGRYRLDEALSATIEHDELVVGGYATGLRECRIDGGVLTLA